MIACRARSVKREKVSQQAKDEGKEGGAKSEVEQRKADICNKGVRNGKSL